MQLNEYLKSGNTDESLINVINSVAEACKDIKKIILEGNVKKAGTENVYGEKQLALDVRSDEIIQKYMKQCAEVGLIASEELPDEMDTGEGDYAVAYDPLDGSSLVDVNLSVGTIVSIYKTETFIGTTGRNLKAALFVVYGPRTTMIISIGNGVNEFELNPQNNNWELKQKNIKVEEDGKMFAPGNLGACKTEANYFKVLEYWVKEGYKLRYSGGMVPDINQILLKGKGIFTYPGTGDNPNGKLRLLFECRPMSYLLEQAGGAGSSIKEEILDIELNELAQRSPIIVGSKNEVLKVVEMMKG